MLWLVQRVFFGPLKEPQHDPDDPPIVDMKWREVAALAPLCVFVLWIGLQPKYFLDRMAPTLNEITQNAEAPIVHQFGNTEETALNTTTISTERVARER